MLEASTFTFLEQAAMYRSLSWLLNGEQVLEEKGPVLPAIPTKVNKNIASGED